eukprot:GFUD01023993.1.p1 GENE.GFUD01023993.1~~GFUD01023993.1.p1  ORF type:complete len:202 (+),score=71.82 GFUD01023993.1:107-712(+)
MGSSSSSLSSTDLAFLTSNTGMKEEEVKTYFQKFKKSGDPRKARISKPEFCQIMSECYPRTYKPELAEDIFRIYDRDNNGTVEFQEFLVIIYVMSDGTKEEKLKHIFRIFDSDGDGSITLVEMTSIVSHLYHLIPEKEREEVGSPEKFSERIMKEMDKNKDGNISEEELMSAFLRQEQLSTLLVNKVMQRAVTAQVNILKD